MINIIQKDTWVEVWTDTPVNQCDGRCIGSAASRQEAIADGIKELEEDLKQLRDLAGKTPESKH